MKNLIQMIALAISVVAPLSAQQLPNPMEFFPYRAGDTIQFRGSVSGGVVRTMVFFRDTADNSGNLWLSAYYAPNRAAVIVYRFDTVNLEVYEYQSDTCGYNYPIYKLAWADTGAVWYTNCFGSRRWINLGYKSQGWLGGEYTLLFRLYPPKPPIYSIEDDHLAAGLGLVAVQGEAGEARLLSGAVIGGHRYGSIDPVADVPEDAVEPSGRAVRAVPTPAALRVEIRGDGRAIARVQLYDALGNAVIDQQCTGGGRHSVDVSGLSVGMYHAVVWYKDRGRGSVTVVVSR